MYKGKRNSVFPLIFIRPLVGFKFLIKPFKIYFFNELFIDMSTLFLTHMCNNRVHFFIFQAKICESIINYYYYFFFYQNFLSRTFNIHQTAGERVGYLFNSSLPLPFASQKLKTLAGRLLQRAHLCT